MNASNDFKALGAMVLVSITYGVAGVTARILHQDLNTWQQVALVNWVGFFATVLFHRWSSGSFELPRLTGSVWCAVLMRALVGRLLGSYFFVLACIHAPLGNVAWVSALPASVLFDRILWGRKVSVWQGLLLTLGSAGVGLIVAKSTSVSEGLGWGEACALISTLLVGFALIVGKERLRDVHTSAAASWVLLVTALSASLCALLFEGGLAFPTLPHVPVAALVGVMVLVSTLCSIYGYTRLSASIATGIVTLEAVWAIILGALLYGEVPSALEWTGGVCVGITAFLLPLVPSVQRQQSANCTG
jgi:drug/metabolite transporter (DMT)-like permease